MSECEAYLDKTSTADAPQSQDTGKRMSILRRPRLTCSNYDDGSKLNSGVSECNQIRGNFLKWASGGTSKQSLASKISSDSSDPKSGRSSFWTRLAKKQDVWDDSDSQEEFNQSQVELKQIWTYFISKFMSVTRSTLSTLKSDPQIVAITLACFIAFIIISITTSFYFAKEYKRDRVSLATHVAVDSGRWFFEELHRAMFPLFSLREFVKEMSIFHELPFLIGQGGDNGAAPYINASVITHRNVSGICDNTTILSEFNRIAKGIKESSKMRKVLVALFTAPHDVACMFYPLNNTEDFTSPLYLDNTGAVGHDLLKNPERVAITIETHLHAEYTVAGPLSLTQCSSCPPAVKRAFIAELPVNMPKVLGYNIYADGVNYSSWGIVGAVINWEELLERSNIFHHFEAQGMQFVLTKTEWIFDTSSGQYIVKTSAVAQSAGAESLAPGSYYNFPLHETTESNWTMSVAGDDGFEAPWLDIAIATSVLLSFVLSSMLMCILIEKRQHHNLLHEMLPAKALKKLEKGGVYVKEYSMVTICFSDIVGYTSMSADMRPIQVMKLLNAFYTEADKLAVKNKVYKIKTIGDAYMCVGGCPDKCHASEGAERAAMFALELIDLVKRFRTDDGLQITLRAGLHSGAVVAGVIEQKRPQYTIFGDAVTVASAMESSSDAMRIQCSAKTSSLLAEAPHYNFSIVEKDHRNCAINDHDTTRRFRSFYIEGATEINYS